MCLYMYIKGIGISKDSPVGSSASCSGVDGGQYFRRVV